MINIAVASNFESTLKIIINKYKLSNSTIDINIISGSSGVLVNQISNHAPFDLFLSADEVKPDFIYQNNQSLNKPEIYAIGQLVLWIPDSQQNQSCIKTLSSVNSLAIANPKIAPYGAVADIILNKHNIKIVKTIYAASIAQAFLYTKNNFTEAGFVAASMLKDNINGCQQSFQHTKLNQSMILLDAKAKDIYNYILSHEIQNLIAQSGYDTINSTTQSVQ